MADAVREAVGIVSGHRHHREHLAGATVDDHRRARIGAEPARGIFLQPGVDRQLLRLAGDVGTGGQFGDDLAACGDFDALGARRAAEFTFQLLFKAILAELETRCDEQGVVRLLILFGVGRADIAGQMRDRGARRIVAREAARWRDAGQFGLAQADRGEAIPADVFRHLHRLEARRPLQIDANPLDLVGRQVEQRGEPREHAVATRIAALQPIGDDVDTEIGAIVGDGGAMTIDDPAAPRRDHRQIDAVAFGKKVVLLVLGDREIAHAAG